MHNWINVTFLIYTFFYEIDRVLKIQPAPAMKAGGQGDRYTVMIGGQLRYLFFEHSPEYGAEKIGKWFVERRVG